MRLLAAVFVLALVAVSPAHAEKRVALVIGNAAYKNAATLQNPRNDATDVSDALKRLGFETIVGLDLDKGGMEEKSFDFARAARDADVALVYYSGHAMQFAGVNYLMPVDAALRDEVDLRRLTRVDEIVADLKQAKNLRILVLDACRDNPLADELSRSIEASRGLTVDRGLARIIPPSGMIISYATQAGRTAADGRGRNSPYTMAFLKNIEAPEEIGTVFRNITSDVYAATESKQLPELSLSLIGNFYLKGRPEAAAGAPAPLAQPTSEAERAWSLTQGTTSQAVLEDYIKRYGDSFYGTLARARLEELKKSQVAVVAPPAAPAASQASSPSQPNSSGTIGSVLTWFSGDASSTSAPTHPAVPEHPPQQVAVVAPPVAPVAPVGSPGPCGGAPVTVSLSSRAPCPLSATEERALKPKDVFKECDKCPEMVVVPAGSFTMGSPSNDKQRGDDETQVRVTIAKPFAVGEYAVTFDQWDACVADGGCGGYKPSDEGWGRGRRPAINVSWDDAKKYVSWISSKTGKPYRLLSEAEREYVTRAGTTTPFWWGSSITTKQANYNRSDNGGRQKTMPVDSFEPNPWGLYQVHGNVWDWTQDCYNKDNSGNPGDGSARASGDCNYRVLRGGSWFVYRVDLRAADRIKLTTDYRGDSVGLRVGRTITP
jgi:formylglycine-generating enzyme required for sulfatase activity/uncharacterized caspase-like protein